MSLNPSSRGAFRVILIVARDLGILILGQRRIKGMDLSMTVIEGWGIFLAIWFSSWLINETQSDSKLLILCWLREER